jgi:mono/diheme cytochrome c family protein
VSRLFSILILILAPATVFGANPATSAATPSPEAHASRAALLARGRYVALAADCNSCHTAPGGKPYAGGGALKSPFGTLYGPNITSDAQTGIGTWSKADFERALRYGVRKDGAYLYPAMPYGSYTKISAADMNALWAFIHSVPAVHNVAPANTLPFPLDVRSGVGAWQALYFKPSPFAPRPDKGAPWNRGAYLVEALGHCTECHTPRNFAQALEPKHQLTGAVIEGWYAPDISSDPLSKVSEWSVQQIAQYLKSGALPGNVKTFGPMQEVVDDSLRYLTASDLHAIALYLKDQPKDVTPLQPAAAKYVRLGAGRRIYEDNCGSCHQSDGKGTTGTVPALAGNDAVTAAEPYNVIMAVLEGFPPQGSWGAMASFANSLSDEQIADVANYVRTAWGNNAVPNATPWSVGDWRKNVQSPPDESHALLCPNLPADEMQPAMSLGSEALHGALTDRAKMSGLVAAYRAAAPDSSAAHVVEALSTAYCRAIAEDRISKARMTAQLADFAQQVAITLGDPVSAGAPR